MDQAKFDDIREGAKARIAAREAAETASTAVWAKEFQALVARKGGPEKYFGPFSEISAQDLSADQSNRDATTKPT